MSGTPESATLGTEDPLKRRGRTSWAPCQAELDLAAQSGNANVAAHAKAKGAERAKRLTLALE